jgi:hypothetical protein
VTTAPELVIAAILFGLVILLMSCRRSGTRQATQLRTAKRHDFRPPGQGYQPVDCPASPGPPPTGGTIAITPRPVYHRQPKKNRRDALRHCNGIAFTTTRTDGVGIPPTCQACGQPLQIQFLDFSQVVEARAATDVARLPRHYGAKGSPVTEIRR